jgi:endoribonuclease Dicer
MCRQRNAKDAKYENVFEWCKAKRKGFEGLVDYTQPLIEVSNLPAIINRLQPTARTFDTAGGPIKLSTKCK